MASNPVPTTFQEAYSVMIEMVSKRVAHVASKKKVQNCKTESTDALLAFDQRKDLDRLRILQSQLEDVDKTIHSQESLISMETAGALKLTLETTKNNFVQAREQLEKAIQTKSDTIKRPQVYSEATATALWHAMDLHTSAKEDLHELMDVFGNKIDLGHDKLDPEDQNSLVLDPLTSPFTIEMIRCQPPGRHSNLI
jgi:hypothetical protein